MALCSPRIRGGFRAANPQDVGLFSSLQLPATIQYLREGRRKILAGNQRLVILWQGRPCDYVEQAYLDANADVAEWVREGKFRSGLDHFLLIGIKEVQDGKRDLYGENAVAKLVRRYPGTARPVSKALCLFVHFDKDWLVDPYVEKYIQTLIEMGSDVVFISGTLLESEAERLTSKCLEVLVRNPIGHDFTSWYVGLKNTSVSLEGYETVLLVNDSVYFPFRPAAGVLPAMASRELDFWGICESYQNERGARYHLQSFFLGLSQKAVKGGLLTEFVKKYETFGLQCRQGYIEAYEYGLTETAEKIGLSVGAYCALQKAYDAGIAAGRKLPPLTGTNPSIHLWRELLSTCECPAVKVGLVRDNPEGVFDWSDLEKLTTIYDLDLIKKHLARVQGK